MILRVRSPEELAEGVAALSRLDDPIAELARRIGQPRIKSRPQGFATLAFIIVGQQVSTTAAAAIWARMEAAGLDTEAGLLAGGPEAMRAAGLTRPKQRYLTAIAEAQVDWIAHDMLPDEEAIARLDALPGVGRWTAEVYAMIALDRADVPPAGDLALQEGLRELDGLATRPDEARLRRRAADWAPWRGVAARLLWDGYLAQRGRSGDL